MPSIEQNLERIASALEVIASNSKFMSGLSSKAQREEAPAAAPAPAAAAKPATDFLSEAAPQAKAAVSIGSLPSPEDRDGIKAELEKRKITYNPRLQTKTLYEMLIAETQAPGVSAPAKAEVVAAAAATGARPKPTPSGPVALTPVAPVAAKASADDVRAALKQFGHVYGNDKALAMLNPFGVQNVTQLAEAGRLDEFMDALKKKGDEYDAAAKK